MPAAMTQAELWGVLLDAVRDGGTRPVFASRVPGLVARIATRNVELAC